MKNGLLNALGFVLGLVVGAFANGALIEWGYALIPPPAGVDMKTPEGFAEAVKLFSGQHFVFPFLAHAVGTLVGSLIAVRVAQTKHAWWAGIVGSLFFLGGAYMVLSVDAPLWFNALDLLVAYFPMAYLGYRWGKR